jgi:hypothetical protein
MKAYWRSGGIAPLVFFTSALDVGEWSASRHGRFTPRERAPSTHWIGGWVGPRAVLDAVVKRKISSSRRKSNPRYVTFMININWLYFKTWYAILKDWQQFTDFITSCVLQNDHLTAYLKHNVSWAKNFIWLYKLDVLFWTVLKNVVYFLQGITSTDYLWTF